MVAHGTLSASQGKGQAVELLATGIEVLGWVDDPDPYPIQQKRHSFEYPARAGAPAPAHQHLRRRRARPALRSAMAIHRFFHEHGFL